MPQDARSQKTSGMLPQIRSNVLVAVGANYPSVVGDAAATIQKAISDIRKDIGVIRGLSRFYRTPAFPAGAGPDFTNAAFSLATDLGPEEVLKALHSVEARYGRDRAKRWGPRTLDLDLIAYGDLVLPDADTHQNWVELALEEQMTTAPEQLILPHPRLAERAFVLVPLADVAPDWCHPVTGRTVRQMCDALSEAQLDEVTKL